MSGGLIVLVGPYAVLYSGIGGQAEGHHGYVGGGAQELIRRVRSGGVQCGSAAVNGPRVPQYHIPYAQHEYTISTYQLHAQLKDHH